MKKAIRKIKRASIPHRQPESLSDLLQRENGYSEGHRKFQIWRRNA